MSQVDILAEGHQWKEDNTKSNPREQYEQSRNQSDVKHETQQETLWQAMITIILTATVIMAREVQKATKRGQDRCSQTVATSTVTEDNPWGTGHSAQAPTAHPRLPYIRHATAEPVPAAEASPETRCISGGKNENQYVGNEQRSKEAYNLEAQDELRHLKHRSTTWKSAKKVANTHTA